MFDAAQHLTKCRGAAEVQQVLQDGAVLPGQAVGGWRQRVQVDVGRGLDGHPQRALAFDGGAVEHAAVQAANNRGLAPIRQTARLVDVGDGAQPGVATVDAWNEH